MQKAKIRRNERNWTLIGELATEPFGAERATAADFSGNCDLAAAVVSVVRLGQGLNVVDIGEASASPGPIAGLLLPAIQVSAAPNGTGSSVEILGSEGYGEAWLGRDGGAIVVRSPPGGGHVLVTAFADHGQAAVPPRVEVRPLDRMRPDGDGIAAIAAGEEPAEIRAEIVIHVEGMGDRSYLSGGWVGNRGRKLRVEAFSIRPTGPLGAQDIEFKALGPNGRQTPWVTDAKLCGTRGQGLPLTGFAIRPASHLRKRLNVVYWGAFFESGVAGPCRNGELCIPRIADDPLEAINVRLTGRADEPVIAALPPARPGRSRRDLSAVGSRSRGNPE